MAADKTRYDVPFRTPVIPYFPDEYDRGALEQFSNVLRLYFTQVDATIRRASAADKSEAVAWFRG